jgi:DNA-binding NarL/FixJ family response regulator
VLLVDDHQLLAHSLVIALRAEGLEAELAEPRDREGLIELVRESKPDLVLLDLDLGSAIRDGATLVQPFREAGASVLVVTGSNDRMWIGAAVERGAVGVVRKSQPFDELLNTVLAAARGTAVMSSADRHQLLTDLRLERERQRLAREPFEQLTDREQQVLHALVAGRSVGRIAEDFVVSEATVRSQVRGVLTKLGVTSQLEAVAAAVRAGWGGAADPRT